MLAPVDNGSGATLRMFAGETLPVSQAMAELRLGSSSAVIIYTWGFGDALESLTTTHSHFASIRPPPSAYYLTPHGMNPSELNIVLIHTYFLLLCSQSLPSQSRRPSVFRNDGK